MNRNRERFATVRIRVLGALVAFAFVAATPYIVAKLYTGRGNETPIRSAIAEQPLVVLLGLVGVTLGLLFALRAPSLVQHGAWLNPLWVYRNRRREAFLLTGVSLFCLGGLELASRALYARQYGFPLFHPTEFLVYPPLYEQFHDYTDDSTNVLLLGGSVLYFAGRDNVLEDVFTPPCRVYNLAQTAHSSLDALLKYRYALDHGYRFDYVIFYEAINEVRANNVPPDLFSADYNHYFFYRLANTVFGNRKPALRFALQSSLYFRAYRLVMDIRETRLGGRGYVNMAFPREDWLHYGGDIKSAQSYRRNLEEIAALATAHDSLLVVPRYAYDPWLDGLESPPDRSAMVRYTEQWGIPEHVAAGIHAHNEVIESLQNQFQFIHTQSLQKHANFIDPCHFSPPGHQAFLDLLTDALQQAATPQ